MCDDKLDMTSEEMINASLLLLNEEISAGRKPRSLTIPPIINTRLSGQTLSAMCSARDSIQDLFKENKLLKERIKILQIGLNSNQEKSSEINIDNGQFKL